MSSEYSDVPPGLFTKRIVTDKITYRGCNKKTLEALGLDSSYPKCKCEDCNITTISWDELNEE